MKDTLFAVCKPLDNKIMIIGSWTVVREWAEKHRNSTSDQLQLIGNKYDGRKDSPGEFVAQVNKLLAAHDNYKEVLEFFGGRGWYTLEVGETKEIGQTWEIKHVEIEI